MNHIYIFSIPKKTEAEIYDLPVKSHGGSNYKRKRLYAHAHFHFLWDTGRSFLDITKVQIRQDRALDDAASDQGVRSLLRRNVYQTLNKNYQTYAHSFFIQTQFSVPMSLVPA